MSLRGVGGSDTKARPPPFLHSRSLPVVTVASRPPSPTQHQQQNQPGLIDSHTYFFPLLLSSEVQLTFCIDIVAIICFVSFNVCKKKHLWVGEDCGTLALTTELLTAVGPGEESLSRRGSSVQLAMTPKKNSTISLDITGKNGKIISKVYHL